LSAREKVKVEPIKKLSSQTNGFITKTSKKLIMSKKSSFVVAGKIEDFKIDSETASK
jgi:hypothetical protein